MEINGAGYGQYQGEGKKVHPYGDMDTIESTTEDPLDRVVRLTHLASQLDNGVPGKRDTTVPLDEWVTAKALALAQKGAVLLEATTRQPREFAKMITYGEPGDHVVMLSRDEIPNTHWGTLRTRDLPFHLMCSGRNLRYEDLPEHVLGLRYALGVGDMRTVGSGPPPTQTVQTVLLVGDNDGVSAASKELDEIKKVFDRAGGTRIIRVATADQFHQRLAVDDSPAIVHFSGHNSGGVMSIGATSLNVESLLDALEDVADRKPIPLFFFNTCSASKITMGARRSDSLADLALNSGAVGCVISTNSDLVKVTPTGQEAMASFAIDFYKELLNRNAPCAVGGALRNARLTDHRRPGLVWAKYVLLGDPRTRLRVENEVPAPPAEIDDWMVPEATGKESRAFVALMHEIHDYLDGCKDPQDDEGAQVVMTLYSVSDDPDLKKVREYEYDLLYYRNVLDTAPMFGPRVEKDDRFEFASGDGDHDIGNVDAKTIKTGSFTARESIRRYGKFKLYGPGEAGEVVGLLYISCRDCYITNAAFLNDDFSRMRRELQAQVVELLRSRQSQHLKDSDKVRKGLVRFPDKETRPASISAFFSEFLKKAKEVAGYDKLRLSVYLHVKGEGGDSDHLEWLWSSNATSTAAVIPLSAEGKLLIIDAAMDENHKPLLIHKVGTGSRRSSTVVQTDFGDEPRADLVIPVLDEDVLLGIVDLQADDPGTFDSDDVQLLSWLAKYWLIGAFENLQGAKEDDMPLFSSAAYAPFAKHEAPFSVQDLVRLNFSPMKFLLRWAAIRQLVTTGETAAPATIEVWPTMDCNQKCEWCRIRDERKLWHARREMTRNELVAIAAGIKEFDRVDVLISGGGEPLLHESMSDFVAEIRDIPGVAGLFTNGKRPADFGFWNDFFGSPNAHRFVRISCSGHDPESYYRVHYGFEGKIEDRPRYRQHYAEMRKIVLDLLGLRTGKGSVALGDTVRYRDVSDVDDKAAHARRLGVDFIQMRPELQFSTRYPIEGAAVCTAVRDIEHEYEEPDFSVVYTDDERAFEECRGDGHDYPRCYAMQLVPTLVPDAEVGWVQVMPCSYAINSTGREPPSLGRMRADARFKGFWQLMNVAIRDGVPFADDTYEVTITQPVNPHGCPECRYYRLNKRLHALESAEDGKLHLVDKLVAALEDAADKPIDPDLRRDIEDAWDSDVIDLDLAQKAFKLSHKLGIVPSL